MGDIADMMINGLICEACGAGLEGGASGHPRLCDDCTEGYTDKTFKRERIDAAWEDFKEAATLAAQNCMWLTRHNDGVQYNLKYNNYLWQIYPGKCRIYSPKNKRAPYLDLAGKNWTLVDVVQAAIKTTEEKE